MTYSFLAPGTNHNTREMIKAKYPTSEIMPMVNQIERHPCRKQPETYHYCKEHGIQLEAYQPLAVGRPELMKNPLLLSIAEKHHCTVAQVALAWNMSTGVIPLPRSKNPGRLKENHGSVEIELTAEEMHEIDNDREHYFRALREGSEYPGYWDQIHKVDIPYYL